MRTGSTSGLYGLNQDSESGKENDLRHVKMVEAMRKDMEMR